MNRRRGTRWHLFQVQLVSPAVTHRTAVISDISLDLTRYDRLLTQPGQPTALSPGCSIET